MSWREERAEVCDLVLAERSEMGWVVRSLLSGADPEEDPEPCAQASPIGQLALDRPLNVLHGGRDTTIPVSTIESCVDRHEETGSSGHMVIIDGADRDSWADMRGAPWFQARQTLLEQIPPETA